MEIAVLIIGLLMTCFGAYLMLCGMCYPEMVSQTQGGFKSREELERTKTKA